jgi:hypothetical protein
MYDVTTEKNKQIRYIIIQKYTHTGIISSDTSYMLIKSETQLENFICDT